MSTARKILIVDDDEDLRESLKDQLALHDEFEVVTAPTASKAIDAVKGNHLDLVLLDVGLPDMDGREACKLLRKGGFKSPIVMLTGNDSDADMILGLDSGANDYVTKPFKFAVLLARIRAQLRQHEQSEDAVFAIGQYSFKPASKMLHRREGLEDPADGEGNVDPQVSLSRRREGGDARRAAAGSVGLQFRRHHAHAGDPHLPPAPEDRERPLARGTAGDGNRRLQARSLASGSTHD